MKIRNGFVSNSSSSSFVIDAQYFPSCFALAKYMADNAHSIRPQLKQKLIASEKYMPPNTPISFYTVNEETYIRKDDKLNVYLVATCHNEVFEIEEFKLTLSQEQEKYLQEEYGIEGIFDFDCSKIVKGHYYFYPEYTIEAAIPENRKFPRSCDKCHERIVQLKNDGTICCIACKKMK